jgi:PKD repeat protein
LLQTRYKNIDKKQTMKKKLLSLGLAILFGGFSLQAQQDLKVLEKHAINKYTPTHTITPPNMDEIKAEDLARDKNGMFYRIGVASDANITPMSAGLWTTLPNGDKLWQLKVKASGAEALSFLFSTFKLYDNASFWVQDMQGKALYKTLTKNDVLDHFQQHVELCFGDEMVLNLLEPAGTKASEFYLDQIMYGYRSTGNPNVNKINESDACQVNVNCTPEGSNWQDEKRGIARILVVDGNQQGWCSGTLINNAAQDCKPYFLTALHCGVTSTTANFNQWKFYFRYEAIACTNPNTVGTLANNVITGCVKKATSNDGGGDSGSDFLLVQLGSAANEAATITTLKSANFNAYWNGWDANNTASNNGVSIHHPSGDIKKISAYTTNTTTSGWNGNGVQSHWQLVWSATTNGHGVTEGGSSGSPLFNYNGGNSRVIGTLTGGSSYCNATSSPDFYGKMSYHWQSNTTSGNIPLKNFLDPANSGLLVLNGSADPCTVVSAPPVANFSGNPTTVTSGGTVSFTDLSSNAPTSWSWTISGTAGTNWSYTGGTSATSQNPQVIFTTVGQYTVTLTATNGFGSDGETKTNYITVTAAASGPCAATSSACTYESINNVTLGSINNTTACTNYGDYTNQSTVLVKGQSYTASIIPQAQGNVGSAYTNDEIAIYIDWNNNNSFTDAGERVGYVLVATGWSNQFTFTVPANATVGTLRMRCRISYLTDEGPIDPCGTTTDGEVEDYSVVVQAAGTNSIDENNVLVNVNVFPNPVNDQLTIDLTSVNESVNVMVYDMTGKLLKSIENQIGNKLEINTASLSRGMYQVVLKSASAQSIQRVIKQ